MNPKFNLNINEFKQNDSNLISAISGEDIIPRLQSFKDDLNYIVLIDGYMIDNSIAKNKFAILENGELQEHVLVLVLYNPLDQLKLFVLVNFTFLDEILNIKNIWKNFTWVIREINDFHRIKSRSKIELTPLIHSLEAGDGKSDLIIPSSKKSINLNEYQDSLIAWQEISPFHMDNISSSRIFFQKKNGQIINSMLDIGYNHLNIEKNLIKHISIFQMLNYFNLWGDNLSYFQKFLYICNLEHLLDLKISERIKINRMIGLELFRLKQNMLAIVSMAKQTGHFNITKDLLALYQDIGFSGGQNDFLFSFQGKNKGNRDWVLNLIESLNLIKFEIESIEKILIGLSEWKSLLHTAQMDSGNAVEYGLTGTILRSTGINIDFRKIFPFYFYHEVEFEVPIGNAGTILDRYLCLMAESIQSIHIIFQLLENLPYSMEDYFLHDLSEIIKDCHHLKLDQVILNGGLMFLETPTGICQHTPFFTGKNKCENYRIRGGSFYSTQFFEKQIIQEKEENILLLQRSLFINPVELDR